MFLGEKNAFYGSEAVQNRIRDAISRIRSGTLDALAPGHYEWDGKAYFVNVQAYETHPYDGKYEVHREYLDIQYIIEGEEVIYAAPPERLTVTDPYDPAIEAAFGTAEGNPVALRAGQYLILWPDMAHAPGVAAKTPAPVKKAVIKIRVSE